MGEEDGGIVATKCENEDNNTSSEGTPCGWCFVATSVLKTRETIYHD